MLISYSAILFWLAAQLAECTMNVQWNMLETIQNSSYCANAVRVAKLNRSEAGLVGNVTLLQDFGNNILFSMEIFHSPLGNNQFTRTPYRIPVLGACDFHRFMMENYREYFVLDTIENFPLDVECPIKARTIVCKGVTFDTRSLPQHMRPGLWKAVLKMVEVFTGATVLELHMYISLYDY